MKNKYLECGKIINTHGVRGRVKIASYCDSLEALSALTRVFIKKNGVYEERTLSGCAPCRGGVTAALGGCETLEDAERLRDVVLYADRDDFSLGEDRVFIADLLGLDVVDADSGRLYGILCDVSHPGASDIYDILTPDGEHVLLPAVPEFVVSADPDSNIKIRPIEGFFK